MHELAGSALQSPTAVGIRSWVAPGVVTAKGADIGLDAAAGASTSMLEMIPIVLGTFAATSPRLWGEAAHAAGTMARYGQSPVGQAVSRLGPPTATAGRLEEDLRLRGMPY
jgi:hypothetical protein